MNDTSQNRQTRWPLILAGLAIALLALYGRSAGVFRGLEVDYTYHSDEPKQIQSLGRFLDGQYIWYENHPMFDGYPLFLQHFDEWLIRPARALQRAAHRHTAPERDLTAAPQGMELYTWARSLRVIYGMLGVWFVYLIGRRLGFSRNTGLAAALLAALAPMSVAVTHFATGDIGTDFFGALAVLLLGLHLRRRNPLWLFLSALMLAWAFAAKYNGALIALVPMLYLAGQLIFNRRGFLGFLGDALVYALGGITGLLIAMPQLVWAPDQTIGDMIRIFHFIKTYHVAPDFAAKPFTERAAFTLSNNLPPLIGHLGPMVCLLAGIAAVVAMVELVRARRTPDRGDLSTALLRFALFAFPFIALVIAVVGKPRAKPFHYSFIQFALCIAAAYTLAWLWQSRRRALRWLAVGAFAATLLQLGIRWEQETFFWKREDHKRVGLTFLDQLYRPKFAPSLKRRSSPSARSIKQLYLEPENPANFRNRPMNVFSADGAFWNLLRIAPVPSVPLPTDLHWIFDNGPVFPRSDRLFHVARDGQAEKHVVFFDPPGPFDIGIRAASKPTRVRLKAGGVKKTVTLGADQQTVVSITPVRWRRIANGYAKGHDTFLVPVEVDAAIGDAWITVMTDPRETANFRVFGGDSAGFEGFALPANRDELMGALAKVRYLEQPKGFDLTLAATGPASELLLEKPVPLPAGPYILELEAFGLSPDTELKIELFDPRGISAQLVTARTLPVGDARAQLKYAFSKTLAPLECNISLTCVKGACRITRWQIRPDAEQLMNDLPAARDASGEPDWFAPAPPVMLQGGIAFRLDADFGGLFRVDDLVLPMQLTAGAMFDALPRVTLLDADRCDIDDYELFFHIENAEGKLVGAFGIPLASATFGDASAWPAKSILGDHIPPGEYSISMGVWNTRTRLRLPLRGAAAGLAVARNKIKLGSMKIDPKP